MNTSWTLALGMLLLLEGIVPFLFPAQWRSAFSRITELSDGQIRFLGLIALACGLAVIWAVRLFS